VSKTGEPHNVGPSLGLPVPTTPGDVGVAGLGLAAGYFGGLLLASHFPQLGVTPGAVSVYTSAAAIGCKNLVQAYLDKRHARREPIFRANAMLKAIDRELRADMATADGRGRFETATATDSRQKLMRAQSELRDVIDLYNDGLVSEEGLTAVVNQCFGDWYKARETRLIAPAHTASIQKTIQAQIDAMEAAAKLAKEMKDSNP